MVRNLAVFFKHIHERDLLKRWQEVTDLLPEFIKVNIGIDYIELILSYTLNKIKENDKIEIEKMLKSHLNPELGGKLMNSLVHSWKQEITMAKEMKKEGPSLEAIMKITKLDKKDIEKLK